MESSLKTNMQILKKDKEGNLKPNKRIVIAQKIVID